MNYEKLNENIMLVELSFKEMNELNITYETMTDDSLKTQNALKKILKNISLESSHHTEKVTVEALPTDDGGCFFIFTFIHRKERYRIQAKNDVFLKLKSLDDVLDLLCILKKRNTSLIKKDFFALGGNYYLSIDNSQKEFFSLYQEFGTLTREINQAHLREYGKYLGKINT